jgi:hypothetical protein
MKCHINTTYLKFLPSECTPGVMFSVLFPCYNFRTNSIDPEWIG